MNTDDELVINEARIKNLASKAHQVLVKYLLENQEKALQHFSD